MSKEKERQIAVNELSKFLTPEPTTPDDWGRVKVIRQSLPLGEIELPYAIATKLRAVLEAETNANAFHFRVANERNSDGQLTTSLWSHKAERSLLIDWTKQTVEPKERKDNVGGNVLVDRLPEQRARGDAIDIGFGYEPSDRKVKIIGIDRPSGTGGVKLECIPYDHSAFISTQCFAAHDYPIAVMAKMSRQRALASIMVFDIVNGKLLGEIEPPLDARNTRPDFALDRDNDVIVAADYNVDWLMVIDVRPFILKLKAAK
ncbi:MAG: hypothetical protein V1899_13155 [Planctomycetota bacterium]